MKHVGQRVAVWGMTTSTGTSGLVIPGESVIPNELFQPTGQTERHSPFPLSCPWDLLSHFLSVSIYGLIFSSAQPFKLFFPGFHPQLTAEWAHSISLFYTLTHDWCQRNGYLIARDSVHLRKTWKNLFGKRMVTTAMATFEFLINTAPGQTLFLWSLHRIREVSIILLPILERRKWRPREATQPISGRSEIQTQIPKLFPLDHVISTEYKGVTDMKKGTL